MRTVKDQGGFVRLKNFGALNGPDGYGKARNHCGETMEMFLRIRDGRVREAVFFSDGCLHTLQAGAAVTGMAQGSSIRECLAISGKAVLAALEGFPADHDHCIRQSLSALKRALRDYALRGNSIIMPEKSSIGRSL